MMKMALIVTGALMMTTSCKQSKGEQCKMLLAPMNQITAVNNEVTQVVNDDPDRFDAIAASLEREVAALRGIKLPEDDVRSARDAFADVMARKAAYLKRHAATVRDVLAALQKPAANVDAIKANGKTRAAELRNEREQLQKAQSDAGALIDAACHFAGRPVEGA